MLTGFRFPMHNCCKVCDEAHHNGWILMCCVNYKITDLNLAI